MSSPSVLPQSPHSSHVVPPPRPSAPVHSLTSHLPQQSSVVPPAASVIDLTLSSSDDDSSDIVILSSTSAFSNNNKRTENRKRKRSFNESVDLAIDDDTDGTDDEYPTDCGLSDNDGCDDSDHTMDRGCSAKRTRSQSFMDTDSLKSIHRTPMHERSTEIRKFITHQVQVKCPTCNNKLFTNKKCLVEVHLDDVSEPTKDCATCEKPRCIGCGLDPLEQPRPHRCDEARILSTWIVLCNLDRTNLQPKHRRTSRRAASRVAARLPPVPQPPQKPKTCLASGIGYGGHGEYDGEPGDFEDSDDDEDYESEDDNEDSEYQKALLESLHTHLLEQENTEPKAAPAAIDGSNHVKGSLSQFLSKQLQPSSNLGTQHPSVTGLNHKLHKSNFTAVDRQASNPVHSSLHHLGELIGGSLGNPQNQHKPQLQHQGAAQPNLPAPATQHAPSTTPALSPTAQTFNPAAPPSGSMGTYGPQDSHVQLPGWHGSHQLQTHYPGPFSPHTASDEAVYSWRTHTQSQSQHQPQVALPSFNMDTHGYHNYPTVPHWESSSAFQTAALNHTSYSAWPQHPVQESAFNTQAWNAWDTQAHGLLPQPTPSSYATSSQVQSPTSQVPSFGSSLHHLANTPADFPTSTAYPSTTFSAFSLPTSSDPSSKGKKKAGLGMASTENGFVSSTGFPKSVYVGHSFWKNRRQRKANAKRKEAEKAALGPQPSLEELRLDQLTKLLPSTERDTKFDMAPPPMVLSMVLCSRLLEVLSEQLRNDSLSHICRNSSLYHAVWNLLQLMVTHFALVSAIQLPQPAKPQDLGLEMLSFHPWREPGLGCNPPVVKSLEGVFTQSRSILRRSQKSTTDFESEEGQMLVFVCQRLSELEQLLEDTTPVASTTTPGEASGSAIADDSGRIPQSSDQAVDDEVAWHRSVCVCELDDELMLKYHAHAADAKKMAQSPKGRMRHLVEEIVSLETSLPPGIFVRHASSRLDVLKALIVGPSDTPYEGGLFEFDILCPLEYPNVSPKVKFKTTGGGKAHFNPNLYNNGKVCLSLLGTWSGTPWKAGESTLLQVLVSIQSMILCEHPWYNEPGRESSHGLGDYRLYKPSVEYNHEIQFLTAKHAIVYWLNKKENEIWSDIVQHSFSSEKGFHHIYSVVCKWYVNNKRLADLMEQLQKHAALPEPEQTSSLAESVAGPHHQNPHDHAHHGPQAGSNHEPYAGFNMPSISATGAHPFEAAQAAVPNSNSGSSGSTPSTGSLFSSLFSRLT